MAPATLVTSMAEIQRHIEDGLGLLMSLEAGAPNETNVWIRLEHVHITKENGESMG